MEKWKTDRVGTILEILLYKDDFLGIVVCTRDKKWRIQEMKYVTVPELVENIEEIIGSYEQQVPSRRYQIQMFLEDLFDSSTKEFISVGKKLLDSDTIRFYIKYVFLKCLDKLMLLIMK